MRVALVSRELYPFEGGGIGQFVAAAARVLSSGAEVTVLTSSSHQALYEQLRLVGDRRLPPEGVRMAFVAEPSVEEAAGWYGVMQCYGARVLERLRELYPEGGPDVLEFPDYLAEGFAVIQAARALDPFLDGTCVCVRIHTSAEVTEVLNGYVPGELSRGVLCAMERFCLAHADRLLWQGGDVLGLYRRFYGVEALAAAVRIRYPYVGPAVDGSVDREFRPESPLRLLYLGRLERRKGVTNLVAAARGLDRDDFSLTLLGGDTDTGPLGVSVRDALALTIADDPRVTVHPPVDREQVAARVREHDVVVLPSLWECWPYAALEALHLNRPLLASPVGGLVEMVAAGVSGWLSEGSGPGCLAGALERLLDGRAEVERLVRSGSIVAHARALTQASGIVEGYGELATVKPRARRVARSGSAGEGLPLVSAVVPYYRAWRYVGETVGSLLAQSYPRLEIVLVVDGSFAPEDWVVAELSARAPVVVVAQANRGLGAARNFGISQSRGRYVFPLDADNLAEPEFVARCVEVLEARPEVAYVTSWSRYIEADGTPREWGAIGYQPLGNESGLVAQENVAGDAAAVIRRRLFDLGFAYSEELTSFEDWHFYQELRRGGYLGTVIPERLLRYRLRADSMQAEIAQPNRQRLTGEIEARLRENAMRWTSSNA